MPAVARTIRVIRPRRNQRRTLAFLDGTGNDPAPAGPVLVPPRLLCPDRILDRRLGRFAPRPEQGGGPVTKGTHLPSPATDLNPGWPQRRCGWENHERVARFPARHSAAAVRLLRHDAR